MARKCCCQPGANCGNWCLPGTAWPSVLNWNVPAGTFFGAFGDFSCGAECADRTGIFPLTKRPYNYTVDCDTIPLAMWLPGPTSDPNDCLWLSAPFQSCYQFEYSGIGDPPPTSRVEYTFYWQVQSGSGGVIAYFRSFCAGFNPYYGWRLPAFSPFDCTEPKEFERFTLLDLEAPSAGCDIDDSKVLTLEVPP